jgi:hypothetical protein
MAFIRPGTAPTVALQDRTDPLARDLALWFPMTERAGGLVRDGSGFGALGTMTAGATWTAAGPNGSAVNCPAAGQITVPNLAFTLPHGPASVSIWINPANYSNYNGIMSKTNGAQPAPFDWYMGTGTGVPVFYYGDGVGSSGFFTATAAVPIGRWNHVALVAAAYLANSPVIHYLNGVPNGAGNLSNIANVPVDMAVPLIIGNRGDAFTQANGKFADARIYARALTPGEIMMLYTDGLRPWRAKPRPVVQAQAAAAAYRARVVRWG